MVKPGGGPSLSVDTEVTAGDKNQTANVTGKEENVQAESIVYNTIDKTDWLGFMIASVIGWVVGWVTKTPLGMWRLISNRIRGKRNA